MSSFFLQFFTFPFNFPTQVVTTTVTTTTARELEIELIIVLLSSHMSHSSVLKIDLRGRANVDSTCASSTSLSISELTFFVVATSDLFQLYWRNNGKILLFVSRLPTFFILFSNFHSRVQNFFIEKKTQQPKKTETTSINGMVGCRYIALVSLSEWKILTNNATTVH